MTNVRVTLLAGVVVLAGPAALAEPLWTATGLDTPESVLFDSARGHFYVSCIVGAPDAKDGAGHIAILAADGSVQEAEWVAGLHAPKGLALHEGTLYVSDIDRLVAIDTAGGEIIGTWDADGAQFLNDVAADAEGRVFVSDMVTNRIHVLEDEALSVWLEGEDLMHPNGLAVEDDRLIVAAWGSGLQPDFSTEQPGQLLTVDLQTKAITPLGTGIGNLDGLEADGNGGWLATDWVAGALYRIQPDGTSEQVLDLEQGSADLEYLSDQTTAIIPMMMNGTVVAHALN